MVGLKDKTIVVFDVETTGDDVNIDQIIQLSAIVEYNGEVIEKFNVYIDPEDDELQFRGGMVINEIPWSEIKQSPPFIEVADDILRILNSADILIGYQIQFDLKFITKALLLFGSKNLSEFKFLRTTVLDPYLFWVKKERRTLKDCISKILNIKIENIEGVLHDASTDIKYTRMLIEPMVEQFNSSFDEFVELTNRKPLGWSGLLVLENGGEIKFSFGKHKDKTLNEVLLEDKSYLEWIVNKSDFDTVTKIIIKNKIK